MANKKYIYDATIDQVDKDLYNIAIDWAEKIYCNIVMYINNNHHNITLQEKNIAKTLIEMNWFNIFPIDDDSTEIITRQSLTFMKYSELKSKSSHKNTYGWNLVQQELRKLQNKV